MKTNEERISEVIEAFSDIEKAKAPDDFETKLMKRFSFSQKQVKWKWMKYSIAAMVLFTLLNVFTALSIAETNTDQTGGDPMGTALFEEELYSTINLELE